MKRERSPGKRSDLAGETQLRAAAPSDIHRVMTSLARRVEAGQEPSGGTTRDHGSTAGSSRR